MELCACEIRCLESMRLSWDVLEIVVLWAVSALNFWDTSLGSVLCVLGFLLLQQNTITKSKLERKSLFVYTSTLPFITKGSQDMASPGPSLEAGSDAETLEVCCAEELGTSALLSPLCNGNHDHQPGDVTTKNSIQKQQILFAKNRPVYVFKKSEKIFLHLQYS